MTNNKMIRDAFGDPIPQILNVNGTYAAMANGDVTGIDFSNYKMIRDGFGDPIPAQYFDVTQMKFVPGSLGGGSGSGADLTAAAIESALGYKPAPDDMAAAHLLDRSIHFGPGEKGALVVTMGELESFEREHPISEAPHQYGNKFEWRFNAVTNSLDLVVLD